jgi:hypothetical protein
MFVSYPEGVSEILKVSHTHGLQTRTDCDKYLYLSIVFYNVSLTITKISILLQYYRIFTLREMRIPVYVALALVSAWGVTLLFTSIFSCAPVDAYWEITEQSTAKCINRMA